MSGVIIRLIRETEGSFMLFLMMLIDSEEDRSKFEIIYETYHRLMFFLARQILPDDRDAEDAVQESFIKIIKNLDKISDPKCPKTKHFIVIIVKRTAIDIKKKKKREPELVTMEEEVIDSYFNEDDRLDYKEIDETVCLLSKLHDNMQ
jgi:RNA polymerase sigma-70 factor (ECF subfamily)